jgi:hypothetical protein
MAGLTTGDLEGSKVVTTGDLAGTLTSLADSSYEELEATLFGRDRRNPAPPTPAAVGHFEGKNVPGHVPGLYPVDRGYESDFQGRSGEGLLQFGTDHPSSGLSFSEPIGQPSVLTDPLHSPSRSTAERSRSSEVRRNKSESGVKFDLDQDLSSADDSEIEVELSCSELVA